MRQRLLDLCIDGNGAFSEPMLSGLKTHISLAEALEIEAAKCKAGDARYEFQGWSSGYLANLKKRRSQGPANVAELDLAVVAKELADASQAIDEHESMLAEHRAQILDGGTGLPGKDVDEIYATLESLRANVPMLEAMLSDGGGGGGGGEVGGNG